MDPTESADPASARFGRPRRFTRKMTLWLSEDQESWLHEETERRRKEGETSRLPSAHGGNANVNRGMIVREALELQHDISRKANRRTS